LTGNPEPGTRVLSNFFALQLVKNYDKLPFMEQNKISSEIQYIVKQIIQKYNPLKVILFGSAVREDYDNINDLDFLIIKEDVPPYGLDRMRELDELIDRNIAVDMLVYRPEEFEHRIKLGDPFIKSIIKEGCVLYG
jgi:predicted nucleotidyltransferase